MRLNLERKVFLKLLVKAVRFPVSIAGVFESTIPLFYINFYRAFERKTTHDRWPKKNCATLRVTTCLIRDRNFTAATRLHNLVAISKHGAVTVGWSDSPSLLAFFLFLSLFFILIPFFHDSFPFNIYIYIYTLSVKLNRINMRDTSYLIPLMLSGFSTQGKIERFGRVSAFTRHFNRRGEGERSFGRVNMIISKALYNDTLIADITRVCK